MITEQNRYRGALLGLACGDAIGAAAQGKGRGAFPELTDMIGGGPFGLAPGQWGPGTSMALCLAESLLHTGGFDPEDQLRRYASWSGEGYMSSTGKPLDTGGAAQTAANAALARLAPLAMYYAPEVGSVLSYAAESTRVTNVEAQAGTIECARLFALQLREALLGHGKDAILSVAYPGALGPQVQSIADSDYRTKSVGDIRASDDAAGSLEAALWCFWHTSSYKQAVLQAANLGDDAGTVAAICGQLAGAYYGVADIPEPWLDQLAMEQEIISLADRLLAERWTPPGRAV